LHPAVPLPGLDSGIATFRKKVFYVEEEENPDAVAVDRFAFKHPEFTSSMEFSETDFETMFWRLRDYDYGFVLAHAMQNVLDDLDEKTFKIRIRTSKGYCLTLNPSTFCIAECNVFAREVTYICKVIKTPRLGPSKVGARHYINGGKSYVPWVYLLFGGPDVANTSPELDNRVALDLAIPLLSGTRGLGKEVFALERMEDYHSEVLSKGAFESAENITLSGRISSASKPDKGALARTLKKKVQDRIYNIKEHGKGSCGYCGKESPGSSCAGCKKAKFCDKRCQTMGWKYHKTWCKKDAASA